MYRYFFNQFMMQQPRFPFPFPPSSPPPGGPPFMNPNGQPPGPPPPYIPDQTPYRVDPGSIRGCKRKYTYIWLDNGNSFWFYPTYVGRKSISGYRWYGFFWLYYGVDLNRVQSFVCF